MKNNTKNNILKYIEEVNKPTSPNELAEMLDVSRVTIHSSLKKLTDDGYLKKNGIPPKVYYSINKKGAEEKREYNIDPDTVKIINDNFTLLEPDGVEVEGFDGFVRWCNDEKRKYDVINKADEYIKLLKEYDNFKKDGFINASQKLTATFKTEEEFLDELYYLYPYSFPVFGKTKMGQWLFHAKQTQNKNLIRKVLDIVIPQIENFIKINNIDSLAFVPPTVPRNIQFMKELEKKLQINVPVVKIIKIKTEIMIQQKGLKETTDRIKNAEETMVIESRNTNYNKILILDDFTGSGSTLNILARKIKKQNIAKEVLGLTIAGSMNGFDVIREV